MTGRDPSKRLAEPDDKTSSRTAAIGPIAAGLLLDFVDFATYGPIGLWAGLALGGGAGYLLASGLGVAPERRPVYALVAGVYCMLPFTAFLPCATLVGALIRWRETRPSAPEPSGAEGPTPVIEAEYRSRWDRE